MHEPEEHRLKLPTQERILDIVIACKILSSEGFGDLTPNEIAKKVSEAFRKEQA